VGEPPRDHPPPPGDPWQAALAGLLADTLRAPQPLAVGRTQRIASLPQRKALAVRDRGCVMPGCGVPAEQCQVHHVQAWGEGGATDLANLASLCWAHHRQVDLGRWDLHVDRRDGSAHGTPANHGSPFTITTRPRAAWRA
jgi:hypothetical protein